VDKKRILLVDDEEALVKAVEIILKHAGYEVAIAYDGCEALEKVQTEKPDLILLDVSMPKMDGYQALERLKGSSQTETIPVIMLTARSQSGDVSKAVALGVADYVVKPFDHGVLLQKMNDVLKKEEE